MTKADDVVTYMIMKKRAAFTKPEQRLMEDLGFDSLELTQLALDFESIADIVISDEDIAHWRTVADVIKTIERALTNA